MINIGYLNDGHKEAFIACINDITENVIKPYEFWSTGKANKHFEFKVEHMTEEEIEELPEGKRV